MRRHRQQELQARLERSEARFRNVIERNADAIVVVDASGTIRYVNQSAEKLFDRGREALLRHPFGFPVVSGETTELELPGSEGSSRVVEMRVVETDWEDEPAYLASLRDMTARSEAESAARRLVHEQVARLSAEEAARRMRFLANSLTGLTSRLDYPAVLRELAQLCVRELADLAIVYGVDDGGVVARTETAHRDPRYEPMLRELRSRSLGLDEQNPVRKVLGSGRSVLVTELTPDRLRGYSRDPAYLHLVESLGVRSFAIVPMVARDRVVGALTVASVTPEHVFDDALVALAEDLAHRAALALDNAWLYGKAQEAIRAQTNLIAMVSHDLRTPLTSMLGYAELLTLGIPEPLGDGARKQVERIRASGGHLLYLIEQLTEFAKLDAAPASLAVEAIDPVQLVAEVADLVTPLALERGLGVRVDADEAVGHVETDAGKLRQILVNLIGNAIKFSDEGEVSVGVRGLNGEVALLVRDSGPGIDPSHLEDIFLPFWQAPGPDKSRGGAGLGLSIVKRLAARLGARITVESTLGGGSTFIVWLPRERPTAALSR